MDWLEDEKDEKRICRKSKHRSNIGIISPGSIFLKHLYLFHILFIYMEEKFFFDVINNSYIGTGMWIHKVCIWEIPRIRENFISYGMNF